MGSPSRARRLVRESWPNQSLDAANKGKHHPPRGGDRRMYRRIRRNPHCIRPKSPNTRILHLRSVRVWLTDPGNLNLVPTVPTIADEKPTLPRLSRHQDGLRLIL